MNNLQKLGGISALVQAAAYIIGFGMVFTVLTPILDAESDEYVKYIVDNFTLMYIWHLIIYVIAGVFLVVLALALHERLKDASPALSQITTAFGLIWAGLVIASGLLILHDLNVIVDLYKDDPIQAEETWVTLSSVENALGGAIELPGGIWILLLSWIGLQTGQLPRALNVLGVIIGLAGVLTLIPALADVGGVFGLGFIVWFIWTGIVMLRSKPDPESNQFSRLVSVP